MDERSALQWFFKDFDPLSYARQAQLIASSKQCDVSVSVDDQPSFDDGFSHESWKRISIRRIRVIQAELFFEILCGIGATGFPWRHEKPILFERWSCILRDISRGVSPSIFQENFQQELAVRDFLKICFFGRFIDEDIFSEAHLKAIALEASLVSDRAFINSVKHGAVQVACQFSVEIENVDGPSIDLSREGILHFSFDHKSGELLSSFEAVDWRDDVSRIWFMALMLKCLVDVRCEVYNNRRPIKFRFPEAPNFGAQVGINSLKLRTKESTIV